MKYAMYVPGLEPGDPDRDEILRCMWEDVEHVNGVISDTSSERSWIHTDHVMDPESGDLVECTGEVTSRECRWSLVKREDHVNVEDAMRWKPPPPPRKEP